jgi:hypothetical protein
LIDAEPTTIRNIFHQRLRGQGSGASGVEKPDERPGSLPAPDHEAAIRCRACDFVVTTGRQRISVQGAPEHRFMNPGGFLFHIGCFAEALGCVIVGPASPEYPWFPGMLWRLALCGGCQVHLGWHFRGDEGAGFFGLILDRIKEE